MTMFTRVDVVTGSRADFGLLRPVLSAIRDSKSLVLRTVVTGTHLLPPQRTVDEVAEAFEIAATIPMQEPGVTDRPGDAEALARGMTGFAARYRADPPDLVVVLGDRIEAFAAAATAAVAGVRVAHLHGGDRAEGIADEGLRHAISKLAHLHLAATSRSVERLIAMGEDPWRIRLVGSPAIDGLVAVPALDDAAYASLGRPEIVILLHPSGESPALERTRAADLVMLCADRGRTLVLDPNHDPGREAILAGISDASAHRAIRRTPHLPRDRFIGLLRRIRVLAGNSSAGLIEAAAIPVRSVDIGARQAGREAAGNAIRVPSWDLTGLARALERAMGEPLLPIRHPYGDGHAGERVAAIITAGGPETYPLAKRNTY